MNFLKGFFKSMSNSTKPAIGSKIQVKDLVNFVGKIAVIPSSLDYNGMSSKGERLGANKFVDAPLLISTATPNKLNSGSTYWYIVYQCKSPGYKNVTTGGVNLWEDYEFTVVDEQELIEGIKDTLIRTVQNNLAHNMSIGSDPEMFVVDKNNNLIPAFDFLASKTQKRDKTREGFHVYWDGYQAEFETMSNTCLAFHTDSVQAGLDRLLTAARAHNKDAKISLKTLMEISEESRYTAAPEHVDFGCMPSLNAYGMEGIRIPGRDAPLRSAGGHIHFGVGKGIQDKAQQIVFALDAIIGVACVSMFAKFDDPRRRTMYGLAGEYRLPPHGIEYRVLSNAWLMHPAMMNMVFDITRKAFVLGEKGLLERAWIGNKEETIEVINTCNVEKAREILLRNKDMFLKLADAAYPLLDPNPVFNAFYNGAESIIENPEDIESNWLLGQGEKKWIAHGEAQGKNWHKTIIQVVKGKKVA